MSERRAADLAVWLTKHARPILLEHLSVDSCIESTAVGLDVLRAHGVRCRELSVHVGIFNAAGWKLYQQGLLYGHGPAEQSVWDLTGAWSVGVGLVDTDVPKPGRFGGHLVALVENRWLLDLSIDQAARLHRGILLEPLLAPVADVAELERGLVYTGPDDQHVVYKLSQAPWKDSYKLTRPWRDRRQRTFLAGLVERAHRADTERMQPCAR